MSTQEPRKLKSGGTAHNFTPEERAKGRANTQAARQAKKAEAEEIARQAIQDMAEAAVRVKWALLASEDETVAGREVRDVFDRLLGKAAQTHEVEVTKQLEVEVRHTLGDLADIARILAGAGAIPAPRSPDPEVD